MNSPFRRIFGYLICLLTVAGMPVLDGCGSGTRYIFSSSRDLLATPDQRGLAYEEVWFPAADGVPLHGWLVPGTPGKPLVLFFHGNAANISHRVDNLAHLHSMGLPVFIFDYRGFGQSGGEPLAEADLLQDARGALSLLADRGWHAGEMIYFGRSLGAAVAVGLALEAPPAGVILEAPFTSLPAIARRMTPLTWSLIGWWRIDDRFDNLERIGRLRSPLLIFHGDRDSVVPVAMSRQLFARARPPKELHIVAGAGHSNAYLAGGDDYRRSWLAFLASLPARRVAADRP